MRVAIYARVSKALDQNPENQLIELRRWASAAGHVVAGEFVDEVSSKDTRPQKERVLRMLRLGEVEGVAFWSLDRWGRTMSELVLELEEFAAAGKSMFSMKEGIDLSTSAGRLMANMLAAMANFERDRIRERTLLGLARVRAQGKKLGRPPKSGVKFSDPHIEDVARLVVDGLSIRQIAEELGTSKHRVERVLVSWRNRGGAKPVPVFEVKR